MFGRLGRLLGQSHARAALAGGCAASALAAAHHCTSALASDMSTSGDPLSLGNSERLIQPTPRKRIAIYGGSFNPITNAHLNVAAEIMHSKLADEVWITPCGRRPDKPSLKTSMVHRLVMCHLAVDTTFGSRFGIKVCDEEVDKPRSMPSIILMRTLAEKYPEADFIFACGADQITEVKTWTAPGEPGYWAGVENAGQKFFDETHFLLIDRPGSELDDFEMPPNCQASTRRRTARPSRVPPAHPTDRPHRRAPATPSRAASAAGERGSQGARRQYDRDGPLEYRGAAAR